jgi:transcription antitermination factor NusG
LQASVDATGVFSEQEGMAPGQKVEFTHGPFSGLVGELQRLGADGRVRVLLTLMGCATSVQTHAGVLRIS